MVEEDEDEEDREEEEEEAEEEEKEEEEEEKVEEEEEEEERRRRRRQYIVKDTQLHIHVHITARLVSTYNVHRLGGDYSPTCRWSCNIHLLFHFQSAVFIHVLGSYQTRGGFLPGRGEPD